MRTTVCVLAAFAALAVVGVTGASASAPVVTRIPALPPTTSTVHGVCSFDFTDINTVTNWTETDFFDTNGTLTAINFEFFSADKYVGPHGATLANKGGHFHARMVFDSSGNVVSDYGEGVIENVPLPDGSTFFAAGRADFLAHGNQPIFLPDWGGSRNLTGFCAALGA
jgi:hypothetical protein